MLGATSKEYIGYTEEAACDAKQLCWEIDSTKGKVCLISHSPARDLSQYHGRSQYHCRRMREEMGPRCRICRLQAVFVKYLDEDYENSIQVMTFGMPGNIGIARKRDSCA